MNELFNDKVQQFIALAKKNDVRMLLVGGGAVNFHGYQRHSADIDFWIELTLKNLDNLKKTLHEMDYDFDDFPDDVKNGEQNISLKISPLIELEIITRFGLNKTFQEAYNDSKEVFLNDHHLLKWNVLSYEDLITSKLKSQRAKDLLDIQELKRINE